MFSQGLPVNLPQAQAPALVSVKPLVVSISREQAVYLGERPVGLTDLKAALQGEARGSEAPEVLLKSDLEVPYGLVVKVMSILKEAGVEKLGIVTAPAAPEVKS
jgi:biopolymer transport protein TolR